MNIQLPFSRFWQNLGLAQPNYLRFLNDDISSFFASESDIEEIAGTSSASMTSKSVPNLNNEPGWFTANITIGPYEKANVNVKVKKDSLKISGKQKKMIDKKRGSYFRRGFIKKVPLPANVSKSKLKYSFVESGKLHVKAPLKQKKVKKVNVLLASLNFYKRRFLHSKKFRSSKNQLMSLFYTIANRIRTLTNLFGNNQNRFLNLQY